jgi:alcohol dehydrogenase, propanol-preferring
MKAMLLHRVSSLRENLSPLELHTLPDPLPGPLDLLLRVSTCAVCHTEIDEIEGRTPPPHFPVIPGHQAVGRIVRMGENVRNFRTGERVGVAWIYSTCGTCNFCRAGNENLCASFVATGRDVHGGYAEYLTVPAPFAHRIPDFFTDAAAAPLLCAGAIGYRSIRLSGLRDGDRLGLTGFGASGHLVLKMVRHRYPTSPVYVFARGETERSFARELGAAWVGDIGANPPRKLHAIIDTTPVWTPVVEALRVLEPGGRLVINAIRKEEDDRSALAAMDYATDLWLEKEIKSVANVTREDVRQFLGVAEELRLSPEVKEFALEDANHALCELKERKVRGAKVLRVSPDEHDR